MAEAIIDGIRYDTGLAERVAWHSASSPMDDDFEWGGGGTWYREIYLSKGGRWFMYSFAQCGGWFGKKWREEEKIVQMTKETVLARLTKWRKWDTIAQHFEVTAA